MRITDTFLSMIQVQSLARNIDHTITCLTALPKYDANLSLIESYEEKLVRTLKEMTDLLASIEADEKP